MYLRTCTAPRCRDDITSALNDSSSVPLTDCRHYRRFTLTAIRYIHPLCYIVSTSGMPAAKQKLSHNMAYSTGPSATQFLKTTESSTATWFETLQPARSRGNSKRAESEVESIISAAMETTSVTHQTGGVIYARLPPCRFCRHIPFSGLSVQ